MTCKLLAITGLAVCLLGGAAYAQESQSDPGTTTGTSAADNPPSVLEDKTKMGAFYTDDTMKTLKPSADFKAAWAALVDADRDRMKAECKNPSDAQEEFCRTVGTM